MAGSAVVAGVEPQADIGAGALAFDMKRKAPGALCAAANDDDDEEDANFESQRSTGSSAPAATPSAAEVADAKGCAEDAGDAPRPGKKAKEFAWMDSDDEGASSLEGAEEREEREAAKGRPGHEDARRGLDDDDGWNKEDVEVSVASLDAAETFGRMMLLAPTLQQKLRGEGTTNPELVVAVCRAMARSRFFDGDILEDLYKALRILIKTDKLDIQQTNDAVQCLSTLNAYDPGVFSAVAGAFREKTAAIDAGMRNSWLEIFKGFGHSGDRAFLQLLEVPPVLPAHPGYKRVRCRHHGSPGLGGCALGDSCSFSHDQRAPLSLLDGGNEDKWRSKPMVMTQNQKSQGRGVYDNTTSLLTMVTSR